MDAPENSFLIGSLLGIPLDELGSRVQAGYVAAGLSDVRPAHAPVFRLLKPEGERVTELAARAGTTKQAMGYLVDYLTQRGYLERLPDPTDGRAHIVRRTERGWEVNGIARRVVAEVQAEWSAAIGADRMAELLRLLGALCEHLGHTYAGSISEISARGEPSARRR